jgi:hypothetical protein
VRRRGKMMAIREKSTMLQLLLLCVSLLVVNIHIVVGKELRIGVMDWQSSDGEPIDDGASHSMTVNFLLAAHHFNERKAEIIPVLGEDWVKSCDVNLTVVRYCDTQALLRKCASDSGELIPDVHAIAGYATAAEGRTGSLMGDVLGKVPVVSHWCTTPQTEVRDIYPMFARTVVADSDIAKKIAKLVVQLGFKRISGLAMREDSSPELAQAIKTNLLLEDCVVEFFDFSLDDLDSQDTAFRKVAEAGLNVIILIAYNTNYISSLANFAKKHGLTDGNKLIIFTNMDFELDVDAQTENANVTDLVRGALRVSTRIDPTSETITNYLSYWESNDFIRYRTSLNHILPPNGFGNSTDDCKNDAFDLQISPTFFQDFAGFYTEFWGIAYDTVLSIGLGACLQNGTVLGQELMDDILKLDFQGLSGRVLFDNLTGNRNPDYLEFQVQNFQPRDGGDGYFEAKHVGIFNGENFTFFNSSALYFRNGFGLQNLPLQVDPAIENRQYLPLFLKAIGFTEFAFLIVTSVGCSFWLVYYRKEPIIINGQGPLMHLICLGCLIASFSIFSLSLDDEPNSSFQPNMDSVCMSIPVMFSLGFQIALLGLCGKTYRIYSIWNHKQIMTKKFSIGKVVWFLLLVVVMEFIILACWMGISPLKFQRLTISTDRFQQPVISIGICAAENWISGGFAVVVFILHGSLLVIMAGLAYQVSDMPGEFGEAHWLGIACLMLGQIYLIALPAIAAVYSVNVVGRFLLATSLVFISAFSLLFLMFAPKMYFLATGKELFKKGSTNSRVNLGIKDIAGSSKQDLKGGESSRENQVVDANQISGSKVLHKTQSKGPHDILQVAPAAQ